MCLWSWPAVSQFSLHRRWVQQSTHPSKGGRPNNKATLLLSNGCRLQDTGAPSLLSLAFFPDSPRDSPHSIKENLTATDTRKTQEIHKKDTRKTQDEMSWTLFLLFTWQPQESFQFDSEGLLNRFSNFVFDAKQFWCKTNFDAKPILVQNDFIYPCRLTVWNSP